MACALVSRQRLPQTHVRSGYIVEGLEKEHTLPHTRTVLTETRCLPRQRCQGLAQGQVDSLDSGRTDRAAQGRQAFGSQDDARAERQPFALLSSA